MILLGILMLIGGIALAKSVSQGYWVEVTPHVDLSKLTSVIGGRLGTAEVTPERMEEMAGIAEKHGAPNTATTLRRKAEELRNLPPPPVGEANGLGWRKFVGVLSTQPLGHVSEYGGWGAFSFSPKRLADLGLVTDIHRTKYQGREVWGGTWVEPPRGALFLESFPLQYQTLVRSVLDHRPHYERLKRERPELFATAVDGAPLTLSGWLALAHVAGLPGALKWLSSVSDRFPRTTALVKKANGIF